MIPIRLSAVLTAAAAAENAAASDNTFDSFAAAATVAAAAWGAVEPTAADAYVRETVKPTAANDADGDGLYCRAWRDLRHHGLHDPLGPRCHSPGRFLAT